MAVSYTHLDVYKRQLPEGVAVGSYYTAEFYGGWEHDYPLLQKLNIDYFVNCWIDSHARIMPYVGHAMDFSDITIKRGLQYLSLIHI